MPTILILSGGGGTQLFFGGCVLHGFQNVESKEQIFLEKTGVLGTKIWVKRARILAKTWLKIQKFSKHWKQGAQERRIESRLIGKGAVTGLKIGSHDRGTSPYPFPMWVPPDSILMMLFYQTSQANKSSASTSRVSLHKLFQLSAKIKYLLQSYTLLW